MRDSSPASILIVLLTTALVSAAVAGGVAAAHGENATTTNESQTRVVHATVTIDHEDEPMRLTTADNVTISGRTNASQNGTVHVHVMSKENESDPFVRHREANVTDSGGFEATFDFTRVQPGTNATISAYFEPGKTYLGKTYTNDTEIDARMVSENATTTETTALDTEASPTTTAAESTSATSPGFGVVVTLVALVGAALLLRRA